MPTHRQPGASENGAARTARASRAMPDDCPCPTTAATQRLAISLTPPERDYLISLVAPSPTETADVSSTRDRLEGKSLAATAGTNFGRDTHEAALGSSVTSVKLSIAEVGVLRSALSASEAPLRVSLGSKLDLLHEALIAQSSPSEQSLASVAASVGLSAASEAPDIVPLTVFTGCLGAGKTTVIRSLIGQLPDGYTCAWLKNEYGDAGVDRTVAQDARVSVREIVNGCLCCTKVG